MTEASTTADAAGRDRRIVLAAIAAMCVVCWIYIVFRARSMGAVGAAAPLRMKPWAAADLLLAFVTWTVTTIGIMLPSAVPLILGYAAEARLMGPEEGVLAPSAVMALGYVAVWTGFSVVAMFIQWGLHAAALLSPTMASTNPVLSGGLLVAAGLFQLTPIHDALLRRCREPRHFLHRDWREGTGGAFALGLEHGAYCLGCCFVLIGVLFVGGIHNLPLLVALAIFVLVEKVLPFGDSVGFVSGPLLILAGAIYVVLVQ